MCNGCPKLKCHSDSLIGVIRQTFEHPSSSITSAYWTIIVLQLSSCKDVRGIVCIYNFHEKQVSGLNSVCPAMRKESLQKSNWPFSIANLSGMNFCLCCTYCSKTDELRVFNQVGWRSNDLYIWDSLVSIFWAIPLIKCIHMQQKPSDMVYSTADIVRQFLKVVRATRLCGHHQSRKKELKNSHCWFVCCHPTTTGNFQWTWCNAWYKSGSIVAMHRIPCILITKFLLF